MTCIQLTFDDQRHDGVGDAERVARHAAVGAVVGGSSAADGHHRSVEVDFDVICRGEEPTRREVNQTVKLFMKI